MIIAVNDCVVAAVAMAVLKVAVAATVEATGSAIFKLAFPRPLWHLGESLVHPRNPRKA